MSEQEILNVFECSNEFDLLSDSESTSENNTEELCGSKDIPSNVYDWDSSDDHMPNIEIPKRQKKKAQKLSSDEEEGNQGSLEGEVEGDQDSVGSGRRPEFCGNGGRPRFCGSGGRPGFCGSGRRPGFCGNGGRPGFCGSGGRPGFCGSGGETRTLWKRRKETREHRMTMKNHTRSQIQSRMILI
ncbi:unnamed protein product [Mytilus edulis]|uniref:Uncharacterized protein n=1 Tax=Mytilus edulis TaxID=6550 RepID=A0A8S3RFZ4_MYTED|nr:unnamed protein product [Mytilus edulis]